MYFFDHSSIWTFCSHYNVENGCRQLYSRAGLIFITYLPFCLLSTEEILFLSNIFTFGNSNGKFHTCNFIFLNLLLYPLNLLIYLSSELLKTVLLCFIKSNCCIYFYINKVAVYIFFWIYKKTRVFLKPPTNRPLNTDLLPTDQLTTHHRPTDHWPIRNMRTRNSIINLRSCYKWDVRSCYKYNIENVGNY